MWFQERDGKYRYFERYIDPYTEKTRTVTVTLTSKSKQAQKQATRILADKVNKLISHKEGSKITFHELYDEYFKNWSPTVKASSLRGTVALDKRIKESISKDVLAKNIDRRLIQDLVNEMMDEGYAYSYYNGYKKRFFSILEFGVRMGYIERNEAKYVKAPKKIKTFEEVQGKRENYLELDEIKKLIKALRASWRLSHIANFVEFMAFTGVRYGEAAALTFSDVDLENGTVTISGTYDRALKIKTTPKTDFSYSTITIPDNVKEVIENQIEELSTHRALKGDNFNKDNYVFSQLMVQQLI